MLKAKNSIKSGMRRCGKNLMQMNKQRFLNGDGEVGKDKNRTSSFSWTVFIFIRNKKKEAEKAITELFDQEKMAEMLEYIKIYADYEMAHRLHQEKLEKI